MMRPLPTLLVLAPATLAATAGYSAEYLGREAAQRALFAEASTFVDAKVELDAAQRAAIYRLSGVKQREATQPLWRAERDGVLLGWFLVDQVVGKHEFITYALGIGADGRVRGIEILDYRETYGYQVREADWRRNFHGKSAADPLQLEGDIPNITGATLSCRNVTNGVKRLLALHRVVLAGGAVTPR